MSERQYNINDNLYCVYTTMVLFLIAIDVFLIHFDCFFVFEVHSFTWIYLKLWHTSKTSLQVMF